MAKRPLPPRPRPALAPFPVPASARVKSQPSPSETRPARRPSIIEIDPDVDVNPEDWVTQVDNDPYALRHCAARSPSFFDAIDGLFASVHDLPFCETTAEAASFCLAAALRAIPSRAGLVHVRHAATGQLVVVYAQGLDSDGLLMTCTKPTCPLITLAMADRAPLSFHYDEGDRTATKRHAFFGPVQSVLVAPAVECGVRAPEREEDARCLGLIELIDPLDGPCFDARAENAISYVASRFAQFLSDRGVAIGHIVAPRLVAC